MRMVLASCQGSLIIMGGYTTHFLAAMEAQAIRLRCMSGTMQRSLHVLRSLLASITTNKDFNEAALGIML